MNYSQVNHKGYLSFLSCLCDRLVCAFKKIGSFPAIIINYCFFFFPLGCLKCWLEYLSVICSNIAGFHLVGRRCWNGSIFCLAQLSSKSNINTCGNLLKEIDVQVPIVRGTQPHNIQQDQGIRLQFLFSSAYLCFNFLFCSHCNVILFLFSFNVIIVFSVGL